MCLLDHKMCFSCTLQFTGNSQPSVGWPNAFFHHPTIHKLKNESSKNCIKLKRKLLHSHYTCFGDLGVMLLSLSWGARKATLDDSQLIQTYRFFLNSGTWTQFIQWRLNLKESLICSWGRLTLTLNLWSLTGINSAHHLCHGILLVLHCAAFSPLPFYSGQIIASSRLFNNIESKICCSIIGASFSWDKVSAKR